MSSTRKRSRSDAPPSKIRSAQAARRSRLGSEAFDADPISSPANAASDGPNLRTALLQASGISFLLRSIDTRFLEASDEAQAVLGYCKADWQEIGLLDICPQLSSKYLNKKWEEHTRSGDRDFRLRTMMQRKDGSVLPIELQVLPWNEGGYGGLLATARNISERLDTQRILRRSARSLELVRAINKASIEADSEEGLLQRYCQELSRIGGYRRVFIVANAAAGECLRAVGHAESTGTDDPIAELEEFGFSSREIESIRKCEMTEPSICMATGMTSRSPTGNPNAAECQALLYLPLKTSHSFYGGLCALTPSASLRLSESRAELEEISKDIAFGIESQRHKAAVACAKEQFSRRLEMELAISQISGDLLVSQDYREGAKRAVHKIQQATTADHAFLYLIDNCLEPSSEIKLLCQHPKASSPGDLPLPGRLDIKDPSHAGLAWGDLEQQLRRSISDCIRHPKALSLFPIRSSSAIVGCVGYVFSRDQTEGDSSTSAMLEFSSRLMGELYKRDHSHRMLELTLAAMDNSVEGILITQSGNSWWEAPILLANKGAAQLAGCHVRDLANKPIANFLSQIGNPTRSAMPCEDSSEPHHWEARFRRRDGTSYLAECSLYPIGEGEAECSTRRYLCIMRDITEREEMESRLAFANKMESIGQLSAGIAHEINTPSQFIGDNLIYLEEAWKCIDPILRRHIQSTEGDSDLADETTRLEELLQDTPEAISDAAEGIGRISEIVRAMRDFSHPGKRFSLANINDCISTTVTVARNEWKYVSDMKLQLDPNVPAIRMLPGEINQVLLNLIVNAAHAIAEKQSDKGTITISTRIAGDFVRTSVSDTGKGIPESALKNIYDPFFTTKEVGKGTGQGLFMAHSIVVQKHRGKLWCETQVGEGTTFHFDLPLQSEDTHEAQD